MKSILKILIILAIFATLFVNYTYADEGNKINVGLFYGSTAPATLNLKSADKLSINDGTFMSNVGDQITAMVEGENVALYNADGTLITNVNTLTIVSTDGLVSVGAKRYRGVIILSSTTTGIKVINSLDFEEYLYGVVPQEAVASWPAEALKTQAVASRSYILSSKKGKHAKDGFDVCTTTHCQVYGGYNAEKPSTNSAVDATRGEVIMYDDKVVSTLYSASNGGYIEDSKYVWGGSYPYFVSKVDKYEKTDSISGLVWEVRLTPTDIEAKLNKYGINIGSITGLNILEKAPSGRVTKLEFVGSTAKYVAELNSTSTILGLKSQLFNLVASASRSIYVLGAGGLNKIDSISILSKNGITSGTGTMYTITKNGVVPINSAASNLYVINGRGYGHGVGLSQWGAEAMADLGFSYVDILNYYYTGTQLKNIINVK